MKNVVFFPLLFLAFSAVAHPTGKPDWMPAPDFTITTSDGQQRQLYQDYINQQKLVVVEAFFTTCPPCNTHAPFFQTLYTGMQAQFPGQVEFLLLSTLFSDTNVKVAQYKTSKGLTMPGAGNDGGSIAALQPYLSGQWGAFEGTPTFFIIAPETGEVFFDIRGSSPTETMSLIQQKIEELLLRDCTLQDPFGSPLDEVTMNARATSFDTTFVASGTYAVREISSLQNGTYTLRPAKNGSPLDGLTTYDLVLISKHILGLEPFHCSYQFTAADVNCSGTVTTFDILQARKVILGVELQLPCGAWRFLPDSVELNGGNCQDFIGVKLGDLNAGVCTDSLGNIGATRSLPQMLRIRDRVVAAGETLRIPLFFEQDMPLEGLQFAIAFDPEKARLEGIGSENLTDFDASSYHIGSDAALVSWFSVPGRMVEREAPVLYLDLSAIKGGWLSELLFPAEQRMRSEAYVATGNIVPLEWGWERSDAALEYAPNPSNGRLVLQESAPLEGIRQLQLTDALGRVVYAQTLTAQKGKNRWEIQLPVLQDGVYILIMNGKIAGKFVLLQR
ncbi:MAG: T9SS type A sorting domain-containing protein [Saprospiraceae bacterium]|nr:T9SS type A sorting domain-containing protein [Saprospiraceae bacterium]